MREAILWAAEPGAEAPGVNLCTFWPAVGSAGDEGGGHGRRRAGLAGVALEVADAAVAAGEHALLEHCGTSRSPVSVSRWYSPKWLRCGLALQSGFQNS